MAFNFIKEFFGAISVEEQNGKITVSAVKSKSALSDVYNYWRTSRIELNMFTKVTPYTLEFYSFFAVEFTYMLNKLIEQPGRGETSKRTLKNVHQGMLENTWLQNTLIEHPEFLDRNKLNLFSKTPLKHQAAFFDHYERVTPQFLLNGYTLGMGTGTGKAQVLSAKIRIPGGWSTMGEMQVGTKIITPSGDTTSVIGVFPQGVTRVYRVHFSDGRYSDVNPEHLWSIRIKNYRKEMVVTTEELRQRLEKGNQDSKRLTVPLIAAEVGEEKSFPIHPYLLGVILGDGHIGENSVQISKFGEGLRERIASVLPEGTMISEIPSSYGLTFSIIKEPGTKRNEMMKQLREIGLTGKLSDEKFIPEEYLEGSKSQRIALLQGLLDTDGTVEKDQSYISFSSTSKNLSEGVQYLVRSLGGIAKISQRVPHFTYKDERKEGKTDYRVSIRHKFPEELFSLERKRRLAERDNQYREHLRLRITDIEEIAPEETQCIMIDHPEHLYVTDDFIVTHNTFTTLALAEMLHADVTVIVSLKASIYRVWEDAMLNDYKKPPNYWIFDRDRVLPQSLPQYMIFHFESLGELMKLTGRLAGKKVALILDESHNLNELTSGRTQQILQIGQRLKPITTLWASATPIKAYGAEAIPMLSSYDPLMTPEVTEAFKKLYGKSSKKCFDIINHRLGNVIFKVDIIKSNPIPKTVPIKIKNPERFLLTTLKQDMKDYIVERIAYWQKMKPQAEECRKKVWRIVEQSREGKDEVEKFKIYKRCFEGISKTTDYESVKEEMVLCNQYEKTVIDPLLSNELRREWRSYKSVLKYLPLKVRGECLGNVVSKRREEVTIAMIEAIDLPKYINEAEKKTIIFTSYVEAVDDTHKYLEKQGFKPISVHGQNKEDLTSQVKKFFDGPDNPLIATFQSLSTSVPLTVANTILALNVPFRDYIFEQAIGRIDRINQDTQTYVFKFVLDTGDEPNISTRTLDILEWSAEQVDQLLGVKEPIALESLQHDLGRLYVSSNGWGTTLPEWVEDSEFNDWDF